MKFAVVPNLRKNNARECSLKVIEKLTGLGGVVALSESYHRAFDSTGAVFESYETMVRSSDIVIAVGGDGTIIHEAKHAALAGKPILGINAGRLGFVSSIESDELDLLENLFTGDYRISKRMMLKVTMLAGQTRKVFIALNDAVISKGALSQIIDLKVMCSDKVVTEFRGDGIIISTPTGSTAYALSAGGPIIDPVLNSIGLTPICSHSLLSRSLIFSEDTKLYITSQGSTHNDIYLTIDGEQDIHIGKEDAVEVCKSIVEANFIELKESCFFEVLNQKIIGRMI